jgi:uncharacterized iron-regulated protein
MRNNLLIILILFAFVAFKPKPAYQIFSGDKERQIDFDSMMKGLKGADVVFFGEDHNNSMCHWLELQVLKSLAETTGKDIIVGAEMFESDDQLILNEYLNGLIKEEHFIKEAKVWDNYNTDYAPMFEFAKEHNYPFIATNVPRRYANLVARNGLEALNQLDKEAKKYIPPLPIEVDYNIPSYKEMNEMMAGHMGAGFMVDAQAIKDATMAYFIEENLKKKGVFYHLNGSYHSKNKEGIVHYLHKSKPKLNIITIMVVDQDDIDELEDDNKGMADFIIAIPSDMTKTY